MTPGAWLVSGFAIGYFWKYSQDIKKLLREIVMYLQIIAGDDIKK